MSSHDRNGPKRGYRQLKQGFRPLRGRVTFFFGEKESNQRKAPSPTDQTEDR